MRASVHGVAVAVMIGLTESAYAQQQQSTSPTLFRFAGVEQQGNVVGVTAIETSRSIEPDWGLLRNLRRDTMALEFVVPLRSDQPVLVRVWRQRIEGQRVTAAGIVVGQPTSQVIMTYDDSALVAQIISSAGNYRIVPREGRHVLVRDRAERLPNEKQPRVPPQRPPRVGDQPPGETVDEKCSKALVSVGIAVVPDIVRLWSDRELDLIARHAVEEMNLALLESGLAHQVRLAFLLKTSYVPDGDMDKDLDAFRTHQDVVDAKKAYAADVVSLWVPPLAGNSKYCGLGYLLKDLSYGPDWAFNVVRLDCALTVLSFAHEVGHNLGLEHDRDNIGSGGADPWSYGYKDASNAFRTVMAYDCPNGCDRIFRYSNPAITRDGAPTGVDHNVDPVRSADNAQTLKRTMCHGESWQK